MTNPAKHSQGEPMSSITPEAVERLNYDLELVRKVYPGEWAPDPYAPHTVYADSLKGGRARLADVRGWGYLTGGGGGALGLSQAEAASIQDALGRVIAAGPALLSTLQAVRGENERLREALGNLEQACDDVAAGRSQAAYLMMLDDGQKDALLALDEARRAARQALSTIQNGGGEGGDYPTNLSPASRSPRQHSNENEGSK